MQLFQLNIKKLANVFILQNLTEILSKASQKNLCFKNIRFWCLNTHAYCMYVVTVYFLNQNGKWCSIFNSQGTIP